MAAMSDRLPAQTDDSRPPPQPMAIVAATSPAVLQSVRAAQQRGLIEPILIGASARMREAAAMIGWDLAGCQFIDAADEAAAAAEAVALVRAGAVASIMKGHLHTDTLLSAVLDRERGLRTGRRLSHIYHMALPGDPRTYLVTDSGVNVAPDIATKVDIVRNAVDLAHALGNRRPRVAILSAIEEPTSRIPSSVDARKVADIVAASGLDCEIDGPLALDNAVSPEAASLKQMKGPVAGKADILVVHDIETGNALSKMMIHFLGAVAGGLVLGAAVPLIVNSRTDPPETRIAAINIANKYVLSR
jgi:phosphate acetyltransferase